MASLPSRGWQRHELLQPATGTRIIIWYRSTNDTKTSSEEQLRHARYTVKLAIDSLQISFSTFTTKDDIRRAGRALVDAAELLRELAVVSEVAAYADVAREQEMLCRVLERYCVGPRRDYPVDVVDQLQQYIIALGKL
ncbi:uncharacterized protein LAJ45_06806 [Morchella importuna]|uniref:uncharacterized protein n=1 Tax=Morchella importuna TaxID=1174673 RepID=UPI001E8CC3FC|nr:uncharacterized protein LAJ45_06806 [Morchella importuna]KAH8149266.1 hypothetical protein LAJ45_06806 [Morchella importuna]